METRYGKLSVISASFTKGKNKYVTVQCDCSIQFNIRVELLKHGKQTCCKSCSCIGNTNGVTHGQARTRLYKIWASLLQRTTNPKHKEYAHYETKKPPVKWFTFEGFIEDMGPSYIDGYTIERIKNDLPYSKDNCTWIPKAQQNLNTSLTLNNRLTTMTITECKLRLSLGVSKAKISRDLDISTYAITQIQKGLL